MGDSSWRAPTVQRVEPDRPMPEREALEAWLDYHRQTLLHKCSGLTSAQLKMRAVPPSSLSLLGLIRHMTEVERWWFRIYASGEELGFQYCTDERPDDDFDALEDADAPAQIAACLRETELARRAVADRGLDEVLSHPRRPQRIVDLRWVFLHMAEEYARHNGHADLLRERIDGTVGD